MARGLAALRLSTMTFAEDILTVFRQDQGSGLYQFSKFKFALPLCGGGGMSLAKYREKVGEMHSQAGDGLSELARELEEAGMVMGNPVISRRSRNCWSAPRRISRRCSTWSMVPGPSWKGWNPRRRRSPFTGESPDFNGLCQREFEDFLSTVSFSREVLGVMKDPTEATMGFSEVPLRS